MDFDNQPTTGSTWNFIGLFLGAFLANTVLSLVLLAFGVLESMHFSLPNGKSNTSYHYETKTTYVLCALLIIYNMGILTRLNFTARSSKVLGYLAGAILPIGLASYWIFIEKIKF